MRAQGGGRIVNIVSIGGKLSAPLALVSRLLPRADASGATPRRERDSESAWSPSVLTALGERAARTQNQLG